MALEAAFKKRLTQTVKRHPLTGFKTGGDPTLSASTFSYMARVDGAQDIIVTVGGVDVKAKNRIIIGPSSTGGPPNFTVQDQIILPDGTKPRILEVNTFSDRFSSAGVHHQEILT